MYEWLRILKVKNQCVCELGFNFQVSGNLRMENKGINL